MARKENKNLFSVPKKKYYSVPNQSKENSLFPPFLLKSKIAWLGMFSLVLVFPFFF